MKAMVGGFRVGANEVHEVLADHMLVDGFHIVPDLQRSHGSFLIDERDGKAYLDFFSNFASQALGWNHPGLADPEFRERLLLAALHKPANSDLYTRFFAEFIETFSHVALPESHTSHVFVVDGGSLAVENALKTAFDWKAKRNRAAGLGGEFGLQVIHFRQAFHGRIGLHALAHQHGRPAQDGGLPQVRLAADHQPDARLPARAHRAEVERVEARSARRSRSAAPATARRHRRLIIEPIQAEGGDNHFRPEFLRALRELADRHDFLLVFDEVQTGLGITGTMWAWQGLGVEPDILVFGKKVQACGIACNARIDNVPDNVFKVSSRINSTWGGNLTDMVRSTRVLELVAQENLVDNARLQGAFLLDGLTALQREFPHLLSQARGRGLMIAFDFPDAEARSNAIVACRQQGLLVLPCGARSVRFRPYLDVTREDAAGALDRLARALRSMA